MSTNIEVFYSMVREYVLGHEGNAGVTPPSNADLVRVLRPMVADDQTKPATGKSVMRQQLLEVLEQLIEQEKEREAAGWRVVADRESLGATLH